MLKLNESQDDLKNKIVYLHDHESPRLFKLTRVGGQWKFMQEELMKKELTIRVILGVNTISLASIQLHFQILNTREAQLASLRLLKGLKRK